MANRSFSHTSSTSNVIEVAFEGQPRHIETAFGGGNGGGDMHGARVGRLEDDMKEVKADLKGLRSDVSELKGKVSMLPGYGGIALIVGVIIALSTLVQIASRFMPPGTTGS